MVGSKENYRMSSKSSGWLKWQAGMRKLKGGVNENRAKSNHSRRVNPRSSSYEANSNQDELLNMLECPICLETADTPPIYQCSEGHLLCKAGKKKNQIFNT